MTGQEMLLWVALVPVAVLLLAWLLGTRYIPHNRVGVIEKMWSWKGSLQGGRLIAVEGEAGFEARILRGGLHGFYFPWQYRIHKVPLVVVSEGKIAYVYARDGSPLPPIQTLGRTVSCNHFQDAAAFLAGGGQRGRQRAFLREGVFALNLALFAVITEEGVFAGPLRDSEASKYADWHRQLQAIGGFDPVIVGHGGRSRADKEEPTVPAESRLTSHDNIGVVTVHDGPPIDSSEIIAPEVRPKAGERDHNYFQDCEAFLTLGGRRGKQLQVLTDGTFFVNRWFATV